MEEGAWVPKHALQLHRRQLFKAACLLNGAYTGALSLKARVLQISETSGKVPDTHALEGFSQRGHCYLPQPSTPASQPTNDGSESKKWNNNFSSSFFNMCRNTIILKDVPQDVSTLK